jgi:pimeloyl-ACP methyl ester carboxylesterase
MTRERWATQHRLSRGGVDLACADYGGEGPPVLLLHGLAGCAEEWAETADWLVASHRVLALDARGHGRSERVPVDVSRAAHVADVECWVETLALGPVVLIGQSLGGHTAFLFAAHRPDLVSGLVVAEATPEADPDAPAQVRRWLERWPVPFASREAALNFFGGDTLWARAWVDGLEPSNDGLRPRFEIDVMIDSLQEVAERDHWEDWRRVRAPTLAVRAERGVPRDLALRMIEAHPDATLIDVRDAVHDVHLEQPEQWRKAVQAFFRRL